MKFQNIMSCLLCLHSAVQTRTEFPTMPDVICAGLLLQTRCEAGRTDCPKYIPGGYWDQGIIKALPSWQFLSPFSFPSSSRIPLSHFWLGCQSEADLVWVGDWSQHWQTLTKRFTNKTEFSLLIKKSLSIYAKIGPLMPVWCFVYTKSWIYRFLMAYVCLSGKRFKFLS